MTDPDIVRRWSPAELRFDPAAVDHTVKVWQLAPICRGCCDAIIPVRPGHESAVSELVGQILDANAVPSGGRPRNAVILLGRYEGERGAYDPDERRGWPDRDLYLVFGSGDCVYARYGLAHQILTRAAPHLEDAVWYAILSQCQDLLDRWEIVDGALGVTRIETEEDRARLVLKRLEPGLDVDVEDLESED